MKRFDQIFTKVSEFMALYSGGIILIIMVAYVTTNVFARYVLGVGGVTGVYEYVGVMLVPLVCLGLSYCWYEKAYISVNILQKKLKGKVLWGFQFSYLMATLILFSGIFAVGIFRDTISSYAAGRTVGTPSMWSPQWPWEATMALGFFFMAIRNLLDLIRMIRTGELISKDR